MKAWTDRIRRLALIAGIFLASVTTPCIGKTGADALEAASVAYADFKVRLSSRSDAGDLAMYLADPKNYDIGISQTDVSYIVVFIPRRTGSYKYLIGGGAQYQIRKSDLSIVKFVGGK